MLKLYQLAQENFVLLTKYFANHRHLLQNIHQLQDFPIEITILVQGTRFVIARLHRKSEITPEMVFKVLIDFKRRKVEVLSIDQNGIRMEKNELVVFNLVRGSISLNSIFQNWIKKIHSMPH